LFDIGMSFGEGGPLDSQNSGAVRSSANSSGTKTALDEVNENLLKCIFVYSYVWGFGGHLSDR